MLSSSSLCTAAHRANATIAQSQEAHDEAISTSGYQSTRLTYDRTIQVVSRESDTSPPALSLILFQLAWERLRLKLIDQLHNAQCRLACCRRYGARPLSRSPQRDVLTMPQFLETTATLVLSASTVISAYTCLWSQLEVWEGSWLHNKAMHCNPIPGNADFAPSCCGTLASGLE